VEFNPINNKSICFTQRERNHGSCDKVSVKGYYLMRWTLMMCMYVCVDEL